MNEQELDDLDHAVAMALGGEMDGDGWRFSEPLTMYGYACTFIKTKRSFCRDWEYGGPIIEHERISVALNNQGTWGAWPTPSDPSNQMRGPTPLIAAMRAFVAKKGATSPPSSR